MFGLNVLLNAISLAPPRSGIGYYTMHLANALQQSSDINTLSYWGRLGIGNQRFVDRNLAPLKVQSRKARLAIYLLRTNPSAFVRHLQVRAGRRNYDLYHEPNFILRDQHLPSVLTVHDLSVIIHPEFHPDDRVDYITRRLEDSMRHAGHITTDSYFIRDEVIQKFGIAESKITVAHLGVDPSFNPADEADSSILKHHGLKPGYVLAVGSLEPRKNIVRLMSAFNQLPRELRRSHPFVHCGPDGWNNQAILSRLGQMADEGIALRLGFVPRHHLPAIYRGASLLAFPSIYEGFGLPALEALACGVPVLAANRASIPEVVGDAALMIDPFDVEEMAEGLKTLLTDEEVRSRLTQAGILRASHFTWQNCAQATIAAYKKVVANTKS